jgi:hypothetical protein
VEFVGAQHAVPPQLGEAVLRQRLNNGVHQIRIVERSAVAGLLAYRTARNQNSVTIKHLLEAL